MSGKFTEIWVYLAATPLLGLTVTLLAYQGAYWIYAKAKMNPLANPVAIAVIAEPEHQCGVGEEMTHLVAEGEAGFGR